MIVDLHNHTKLCNHANGEIYEYIQKAIECNTKYFGFSEHAPMDFDQKYRISFEQMSKYEQDILNAKAKYKDKIEILLGYEVDYLKGYMNEKVLNANVDYLIGSVHFLDEWGFDNPEFIGNYENQNIDEIWQKYFDTIEDMANSRLFDIVGHLDLIKIFKFVPKQEIIKIARNALIAIKEADMSIEINVAGLRKPIGEVYPSIPLLKEAKNLDISITFASDAHTPEQVGLFSEEAVDIAKNVGYTECVFYRKRKKEFINIL
jgi:histidinol-phosphatase (PHP family)